DNYSITNNGADFTISKRNATWTTSAASKTYGDADPSPLTTGASAAAPNNFLAADNVTATYSRVAGETVANGPYHITAALSAAAGVLDNYNITNNGADFTISKRNATWTTSAASKTYGDADPSPLTTGASAATPNNFLAADGVTATYSRAVGETVANGPYHITAALSAAAGVLDNYSITNNGADFTISKRNATWTTSAASKTYGDADPNPLTTGSGSNFVDAVSASYSRAPGETVAGGPYHITAALNATAGVLDNYSITNAGADFTINKATPVVAVSFAASPITYDGGSHPATATVTGVASADLSSGHGIVTIAYTPGGSSVPTNAGSYSASAHFASSDGNYTDADSSTPASLTINAAPVTATAGNYSGVYDGSAHSTSACAVTGTYKGDLSCTNDLTSVGPGVSSGDVNPVVSGTGLSNFAITPVKGAYSISKAPVTATGGSYSGVYDGSAHSTSACSVTGTYKGDLSCTNDLTSVGPDVSSGAVTPQVSGTGLSNFTINKTNGAYAITPAPVTATAGSYSGVYDALAHSPSACVITGAYTGDLTCANTPSPLGPDVGSGAVTPQVSGTGLSNFAVSKTNGAYSITKANAIINVTPYNVIFDGSPHLATGTATGVGGVDLSAWLNLSGTNHILVGDYPSDPWSFNGGTNYNNASGAVHDSVGAWTINGYYSPVNWSTSVLVWNSVKGGSTVPLKFNVLEGSANQTSVSVVQGQSATLAVVSCAMIGLVSDLTTADVTNTGNTALRYDSTSGQFIQNWQTPTAKNTCYLVRVITLDGSRRDAYFQITK
ncbi:MAG: PxKF domain-containing protein, partial [Terriglobales bacterium]